MTRLVVCAIGGGRPRLHLPESKVDAERGIVSGGERSLYELAAAAAQLGWTVELRGYIDQTILDSIAAAVGSCPRTGLTPRLPDAGDIVVMPDASNEDLFLSVHLSEARGAVYLLAPPGLFGWSFLPGWQLPDPLTVTPRAVGLPESYRSMARLGFSVWTRSIGMTQAARQAGVPASFLGSGFPPGMRFPEPRHTHDVAVIAHNRWFPLSRRIIEELEGCSVLTVGEERSQYGLHETLAAARILAFPTRVEGASRICREARLVGTVPVVLSTNVHVTAEDWGEGVVTVDSVEQMPQVVRQLLSDPERLGALSDAARADARRQGDWKRFLGEVEGALAMAQAEHAPDPARAELGRILASDIAAVVRERDEWHQLAEERLALAQDRLAIIRDQRSQLGQLDLA